MKRSKKLQLKISKTKKRLSSEHWQQSAVMLAISLLFFFVYFGYRLSHLPMQYSLVFADIPVLSVPLPDETFNTYEEKPKRELNRHSVTIVLDDAGNFFFGEAEAFTTNYHEVRNKFIVPQVEAAPQTGRLLEQINRWLDERERQRKIKNDGLAILVPASNIPMNIIIMVMADLRYSDVFDRVVLANGLL